MKSAVKKKELGSKAQLPGVHGAATSQRIADTKLDGVRCDARNFLKSPISWQVTEAKDSRIALEGKQAEEISF